MGVFPAWCNLTPRVHRFSQSAPPHSHPGFLDRYKVSRRFSYIPTPKGVFYSGGIGTPRRVLPPHPGVPHRTPAKRPYLAALIGRPEP